MHAMIRTHALDFLDGYVGRCGDPFHVWPDIDEDEYRVRAKAAHQVIDLIHEKDEKEGDRQIRNKHASTSREAQTGLRKKEKKS